MSTAFWDFWNWPAKIGSVLGSGAMLVMGRGGGAHFDALPPRGSCGGDVQMMLARYGVREMWGRRVTRDSDDELMAPYWIAFDIPARQAQWTNYLLQRYGCRVSYRMIDKAAQHAVGMPVPWSGGDHTGIEQPQGAAPGRVAGHLHAGELPKPAEQPVKAKRGWFDGVL